MTLQEQAWQSGLVLLDETAAWNETDWPPLLGGWRRQHASVVLNHLDSENDNDHKRQTVIVLGGYQTGQGDLDSILVLNLAESNREWREGPPMNKSRREPAAVVCNGRIYVMGGYNREGGYLNCMERIDSNDLLLQSSFTTRTTQESYWTTLKCRLSTGRYGCCAVAVHNRYIVVMGGWNRRSLSSVDIIDASNHTVTAGPSMKVPRLYYASAVVGHRIFVGGGREEESVEYLEFAKTCGENKKTKAKKDDKVISFSSTWRTHSDMVISASSCAVVAMGSCLVVAGRTRRTVEVLDTNRNLLWNLPSLENGLYGCSMVTVANQVAIIGGLGNSTCLTLPLMDKNSWCFQRLCEQQPNGWYHQWKEMGRIRDANTATNIDRAKRKDDTCVCCCL